MAGLSECLGCGGPVIKRKQATFSGHRICGPWGPGEGSESTDGVVSLSTDLPLRIRKGEGKVSESGGKAWGEFQKGEHAEG